MIGKLERVDLRKVWPHEAKDFTSWLEENIEVVSDAIDLPLTGAEREQAAGPFAVDVVAEGPDGTTVVIENQLERSNHDHLGKLLTYLVAFDAKAAIWIVADPRPEHVSVIAWLNEAASVDFYLIKLEAIRIEGSPPAPLLTKIVGPSEEAKAVGRTKQEVASRHAVRERFWTGLLDLAKEKTNLHSNISPGPANWVETSAGMSGLSYSYIVRQHDTAVELYIDRGKESAAENKSIFDSLRAHHVEIDDAFGGELEWDHVEGRQGCRIRHRIKAGGWQDEDAWQDVWMQTIDAMIRLEAALRDKLRKI